MNLKTRVAKLEEKAVSATPEQMLIVIVPVEPANKDPEIIGYNYQGKAHYPNQGQSLDQLEAELIQRHCTPSQPVIIALAITN